VVVAARPAPPGHRAWAAAHRRARVLDPRGGWLVLAPHPDDEALGTGAMMRQLADRGERVRLAFLTDGSGSHPDAPGWSRERLAGLRRREAAAAARVLGAGAPLHLDWTDARPHAAGDPAFAAAARRLGVWCRRHRLANLAVTWEGDPHCDHEAAAALARAVPGVRVWRYVVWGWTRDDARAAMAGERVRRLPAARPERAAARRALACHRSQMGGRVPFGPGAFRLPRFMRRLVDRPATLLLEA